MDTLALIGRKKELFSKDIQRVESELRQKISLSRFLVLGGAGSIGQAVTKEIFKRNPQKLHVVDLSENNLAELVRDIRSSLGYISGEFKTFVLDIGSEEYDAFISFDGKYDYVLNLSALKHVRSEKDPFTLMRMIQVNILNTEKTIRQSIEHGVKKYFCVSTDKAANPVNMMGASKRIMELFVSKYSNRIDISMARFANVAFSDGSLLSSFNMRIQKRQPIVAPKDIKRYFVTPQESGELCLTSCLLGESGDIFFPKLNEELHLIGFDEIAIRLLKSQKKVPVLCSSEEEARSKGINDDVEWPCYFSESDTTGEKPFEEFYTQKEIVDFNKFDSIGVIKTKQTFSEERLNAFKNKIGVLKSSGRWTKSDLLTLFKQVLPFFDHEEKGKSLDEKM